MERFRPGGSYHVLELRDWRVVDLRVWNGRHAQHTENKVVVYFEVGFREIREIFDGKEKVKTSIKLGESLERVSEGEEWKGC